MILSILEADKIRGMRGAEVDWGRARWHESRLAEHCLSQLAAKRW